MPLPWSSLDKNLVLKSESKRFCLVSESLKSLLPLIESWSTWLVRSPSISGAKVLLRLLDPSLEFRSFSGKVWFSSVSNEVEIKVWSAWTVTLLLWKFKLVPISIPAPSETISAPKRFRFFMQYHSFFMDKTKFCCKIGCDKMEIKRKHDSKAFSFTK